MKAPEPCRSCRPPYRSSNSFRRRPQLPYGVGHPDDGPGVQQRGLEQEAGQDAHQRPRRGPVVFSSALLPLTICGILIGAAVTVLGGGWSRWKRLVAVTVASAAAGLGTYLVAQGLLGALPHHAVATWAALSATVLSMSLTAAGLARVIGPAGPAVTAAIMVFVGNPFSAVTSAPPLLPAAVNHIGQALPPGAGANLLRSTAYFDGRAAGGHIAVLALWTLLGATALLLGRRPAPEFASAPASGPAHARRDVTIMGGTRPH